MILSKTVVLLMFIAFFLGLGVGGSLVYYFITSFKRTLNGVRQ